jgi:hypothetical protein
MIDLGYTFLIFQAIKNMFTWFIFNEIQTLIIN